MSWIKKIGQGLLNSVPIVGPALGTVYSNWKTDQRLDKANRFSERMRDTAHQAEISDLEKAGMSKMVAYGGSGAQSPAGQTAPYENPMKDIGNNAAIVANINKSKSEVKLNEALANEAAERANTQVTQRNVNNAQQGKLNQEVTNMQYGLEEMATRMMKIDEEIEEIKAKTSFTNKKADLAEKMKEAATLSETIFRNVNQLVDKVDKSANGMKINSIDDAIMTKFPLLRKTRKIWYKITKKRRKPPNLNKMPGVRKTKKHVAPKFEYKR